MESAMVSIRRSKRLRLRAERSSVLAPLPRFCDKGTAPQNSTQTKPDSVHPMPSNDVCLPEGACVHFAMWLKENGESSLASRERNEARARVAGLEERVRHVEEILRHLVQEYESKLNGLQNNVDQLRPKAEFCERKWKEQEALHQEKATRLEEVLKQLEEANSDLAKVTQSHDMARTRIEKLTSALTRTRKLYEQAEVEVKKVQQDCEMDRILGEIEKEERGKKRIALTTELELVEGFQNQNQKMEGGIMPTPELNKDVSKQVEEAEDIDELVDVDYFLSLLQSL
ncbi:golgin subfamily A member 6-like protein 6 isoform X4 [Prunus dulcis]|uniref:golgin subfamily A member 6-like protein 6 isoform X4 n=1 Tax=Prunus dulcis TaxID=3755 RepID=UPI001482CAD3|nr:golgin subfamily A member 6-like protein 6 isoform X4 [Prunus dulcis]